MKSHPRLVRFELSIATLLSMVGAVCVLWLLVKLWQVLLLVFVALILVGILKPLCGVLEQRGLPRRLALVAVFLGVLGVGTMVGIITLPVLFGQLSSIVHDAPLYRDRFADWMGQIPLLAPLAESVQNIDLQAQLVASASRLFNLSSRLVTWVAYAGTAVVLAFYFSADGPRIRGFLYALVPRSYHLRLARILGNLGVIVGGYMRGQLITSLCMTAFVACLLSALGVPNAFALAVFAGITDVVPFVGGLLATTPVVLATLPRGSGFAVAVLISMLAYQELESRVLVPRVYGRILRLPPAAVILAMMIGGALLGIVGALLALPVAAGLRMIIEELHVSMPGDDTDDAPLRKQDALDEQVYADRSAGSPPEEAAVIAKDLVDEIDQAHLSDSEA